MSSVRMAREPISPSAPCSRCGATDCHWDRLANKAICPDCQELLVRGEAEPLIERREPNRCAVCERQGTIRFLSFPLREPVPVEIDLCPLHIRDLLARRLTTRAFQRLRRQLNLLGFAVEQLFLLHESFYSEEGEALHPVPELF